MSALFDQFQHLFHYDGLLHWCALIALLLFVLGTLWLLFRILLPIRILAKQALSAKDGQYPEFDIPSSGLKEIEQLRTGLHYMISQVRMAREQEIHYRNALTEIQENERKHLAHEIHDDTIQSLILVAHSIQRASAGGADSKEYLENAQSQLLQTIDGLRKMIGDLRPTVLDELGLAVAIEGICEETTLVDFSIVGNPREIDHPRELALFRTAQEAVQNAKRHAKASKIAVTLCYSDQEIILDICDDGLGFQLPSRLEEFAVQGHYGLIGIRERITHLAGQLELVSERAKGTRITVSFPIHAKAAQDSHSHNYERAYQKPGIAA